MNIIIDGNAFLNVATSIVKNILAKDRSVGERYFVDDLMGSGNFSLKQSSKDQFKRFSMNYLGSILAPFKDNLSSVFIVFDSRSWRKQFIKDHVDEHGEEGDVDYKGKRKYDDKTHLFFNFFQDEVVPELISEFGIHTAKLVGAEGDDLIAYLCEKIDEDICIWSVDKDLTQLLENGSRKVIMIMPKQMTKFKKIYTTENFDSIQKKEVDLFNFSIESVDNSALVNVIHDLTTKDYRHFPIDPTAELVEKILGGDGADNIPRIHHKMTASKIERTMERMKETFDWNEVKSQIDSGDSGFMTTLGDIICEVLKIVDPGESQATRNNLSRNRTLIRLNIKVLPSELVSEMDSTIDLSDRRRFNYFKFKKIFKS